jgi:hypothetical protein
MMQKVACSCVKQHQNAKIGIQLAESKNANVLTPKLRYFGVNQNENILTPKGRNFVFNPTRHIFSKRYIIVFYLMTF